ncbi:G-D-S-L family lipolytic protein [Flavobacterium sp. GSP27]|uniref:G-D-S-L family lipolytic protein n=1 Tax=Flavobacterium bomense TaxID=2497483 RepID=A0A3S0P2Q6_9FLAO|nr:MULTISPECIES: SGNH/GDSL hydrolase family protein [Flavobacterium]RTY96241.1 G-D-S-L family lipolytic protein [Flavobacterium sp. GSN2]RTY70254.1 G-D-S-L family lipolytic protein [Flavobacterium sp. LB2P53]RTY76455.1 G-D-S-L family lipolytic protein [Flavobacterium sp. LS1R10]RTY81958.1 G-D-S-L family lipolytic protein [Flavobacterium sp. ZB4P23]RTY85348.1 G-D-S-L family lipolytic protein [Flavobacterium sp. LS1P28]
MIKNFKWLLLISLTFAACNNEDDNAGPVEVPITSGTASFSKYVALGDSFAAGYSDGALFKKGQENSYVNILSQQFALAGGGEFKTPYTNDNIGGLLLGGNVIATNRLYFNGSGPVQVSGTPTTVVTNKVAGPINNLGIPGAKSFHLVAPGYGNVAGVASGAANPYFARFASASGTTVLADALTQAPTFFSLWIGGNDVLTYATSGGIGVDRTGNFNPATYGSNDITDPTVFANVYTGLVNALTANGAKGVVANLPYVTTLPYFTTVPYNPVPLTAAVAAQLNGGYAAYNGGLQAMVTNGLLTAAEATRRTVKFAAGANAVVIVDSYLTNLSAFGVPSFRQATKEDLLVLTSRTFIGTLVGGNAAAVNGVSVPLADNWVLSKAEVAEVKVATDAYNVTIKAVADAKGLAFVDAKATMAQLSSSGIRFGNFHITAAYVTGGAFSLDGVHPSARGYALIANLFANSINAKYTATLRPVDLGLYPIQYPASIQ